MPIDRDAAHIWFPDLAVNIDAPKKHKAEKKAIAAPVFGFLNFLAFTYFVSLAAAKKAKLNFSNRCLIPHL